MEPSNGPNILLCVTGSVAAIKTVDICKELKREIEGINIKVCVTKSGKHFVDLFGMNELQNEMKIEVYEDETEWNSWNERGDAVVHIDLRKWAHILLMAPLSANTLSKLANGMSDNLITSVFRAWNFKEKHVIVAPAMNTLMWNSPFTEKHLGSLQRMFHHKFRIIPPISKKLMCGDIGKGAMATPPSIAKYTKRVIEEQQESQNKQVQKHQFRPKEKGLIIVGLLGVALMVSNKWKWRETMRTKKDADWSWFS